MNKIAIQLELKLIYSEYANMYVKRRKPASNTV